jgi:hypothetical protein
MNAIDPATRYCVGAPSIPAFFAGMGGKEYHSFLAGSINTAFVDGRLRREQGPLQAADKPFKRGSKCQGTTFRTVEVRGLPPFRKVRERMGHPDLKER